MTPLDHYDAIVIGAGQGGGPLAGDFARAGRRTALVERAHVGGTCVNEGCSPTKTMVASARVAYLAHRAAGYGVHVAPVGVELARVRQRKQAIVDSFRSVREVALARAGVEVIRGHGRFSGPRTVDVRGEDGVRAIAADVIVVNAGLRPAIPRVPGLEHVPLLTSTSIMELDEVPEHLIVLGGGYAGVEFAQMFRRFGSRVTVLEHGPRLLPREDLDVAEEVARILKDDGIDVVLGAEAASARVDGSRISLIYRRRDGSAAGEATADGSHLLVATGRIPNTDDLNLGAAGVETDRHGFVRVNERLETTAPGVYAIGDVKGGPAFTHISYDDFRILRTNLLAGGSATTVGRLIPYTVFIDPQLGRVGMTEREALAAGRRLRIAKLPMSHVARALEVDETRGIMKAVVDADTGRILGAAVLGLEGGEIATLLQIAMMGDLPYSALRDGVFSHPTLAESLNNLFIAMDRDG
ncbi:MAG TPA: mercuric reductase [Gemmatimonadaceae bacterium]|nr:mercuric reductase [Gemmatimonadaceae bacterium]